MQSIGQMEGCGGRDGGMSHPGAPSHLDLVRTKNNLLLQSKWGRWMSYPGAPSHLDLERTKHNVVATEQIRFGKGCARQGLGRRRGKTAAVLVLYTMHSFASNKNTKHSKILGGKQGGLPHETYLSHPHPPILPLPLSSKREAGTDTEHCHELEECPVSRRSSYTYMRCGGINTT